MEKAHFYLLNRGRVKKRSWLIYSLLCCWNNKTSWGRKTRNIPGDELAEHSSKQLGLGCVCYCDGRRIRVWLILPGVRCGVGEWLDRGLESVHRCRGRGEARVRARFQTQPEVAAGLGCLVCVSVWAHACVELGAWGGDYTVTLFTLFMHTRPLWVPLCRVSVYLNLFWENSTWLGRGSL